MIAALITILILIAAAVFLIVDHIRYGRLEETEAKAWLARRGWRIDPARVLRKITHEDPEGWWTGYPRGKVRNARHARRLIEGGRR